jgi:hypothetical protein
VAGGEGIKRRLERPNFEAKKWGLSKLNGLQQTRR